MRNLTQWRFIVIPLWSAYVLAVIFGAAYFMAWIMDNHSELWAVTLPFQLIAAVAAILVPLWIAEPGKGRR